MVWWWFAEIDRAETPAYLQSYGMDEEIRVSHLMLMFYHVRIAYSGNREIFS